MDADRAIELALSLDIPFWPQLPRLSYYEDMYVQASEHFPGTLLDLEKQTLGFSTEKFALELEEALALGSKRRSATFRPALVLGYFRRGGVPVAPGRVWRE